MMLIDSPDVGGRRRSFIHFHINWVAGGVDHLGHSLGDEHQQLDEHRAHLLVGHHGDQHQLHRGRDQLLGFHSLCDHGSTSHRDTTFRLGPNEIELFQRENSFKVGAGLQLQRQYQPTFWAKWRRWPWTPRRPPRWWPRWRRFSAQPSGRQPRAR